MYDQTANLTVENKASELRRAMFVHPKGFRPWRVIALKEDEGTVMIRADPPCEPSVTDEIYLDDVFRCNHNQWVVGWCMRCATPYRHDCPECGGTKAALIVEDDEVMYKHPSGRECRITVDELEGEYSDDPTVQCPECGDDAYRSVENDVVFYDHSDGRTCVLSVIQDDQRREA
ncbi:hypothetical protein [Halorubrum sp. DTA98]|uniref:hypothetical protein n=1 Tax=Halorubrum sp. DTA98 TaxID=3402163 RepID=UPI003AAB9807